MDFATVDLKQLFFRKTIGSDLGEVSMDADMVRLLLAIDPAQDVARIARQIGMAPTALKQALTRLLKVGLIEPVKSRGAVLDPSFLERLRHELIKAVGPIGEFLIEDVAGSMNLAMDAIPVQQAAELIVNLAREIPNKKQRVVFQSAMKAHLPQ